MKHPKTLFPLFALVFSCAENTPQSKPAPTPATSNTVQPPGPAVVAPQFSFQSTREALAFPAPDTLKRCQRLYAWAQEVGENPFELAQSFSNWESFVFDSLPPSDTPRRKSIVEWNRLSVTYTKDGVQTPPEICQWPRRAEVVEYSLAIHGTEGTNGRWHERTGPDQYPIDHWVLGGLHWKRDIASRVHAPSLPQMGDYAALQWVLTALPVTHSSQSHGVTVSHHHFMEGMDESKKGLAKGLQLCAQPDFAAGCSYFSFEFKNYTSASPTYFFRAGTTPSKMVTDGNELMRSEKIKEWVSFVSLIPYDLTGKTKFEYNLSGKGHEILGNITLESVRTVLDNTVALEKDLFVRFLVQENDGTLTVVRTSLDNQGHITILGINNLSHDDEIAKGFRIIENIQL